MNITYYKKIILLILYRFRIDFSEVLKFKKIKSYFYFIKDYKKLLSQKKEDNKFHIITLKPYLNDKNKLAGTFSGHYFHQDLYVARKIYEKNPEKHIDIGSRIDGFVSHVAVFREIELIDIRNMNLKIKNIKFIRADLMQPIPLELQNSCDSISSLHAIEHFGLGRYGDPIDYYGHIKAINNIYEMLKKNGVFYFSVPIGTQRIEFNAHRVFSVDYLLDLLNNKFTVESISFVDDNGNFHEEINYKEEDIHNNFGCNFGCGIFILNKV